MREGNFQKIVLERGIKDGILIKMTEKFCEISERKNGSKKECENDEENTGIKTRYSIKELLEKQ